MHAQKKQNKTSSMLILFRDENDGEAATEVASLQQNYFTLRDSHIRGSIVIC